MAIRVVRLGTERAPNEGLRVGTARRPPRGVPKSEFASANWYDVWLPNLAPAADTVKLGQASDSPRDESRCHRSILRQLLLDRGAEVP
jgi:uncharacterized protein YeaO (DUF488 family)